MSYHDVCREIIRYIRQSIYDGKEPDEDGFYSFPIQEFSRVSIYTARTLKKHLVNIAKELSKLYDFEEWARFKGLKGEHIYIDVSFDNKVIKFRQNPLTKLPEYEFLWGLPLLDPWTYMDWMDDEHRRRCTGENMVFDAIPFKWDADLYKDELVKARQEIKEHRTLHLYVPWNEKHVEITRE